MQEILQQENGVLPPAAILANLAAGNRILSMRHLRTVRFTKTPKLKREEKNAMRIPSIIAAWPLWSLLALTASAQTATNGPIEPVEAERIIQKFTAKEAEFRRALNNYSFKRDALIQSIGMGGQVIGEYHRVSIFTFDDQGNRYEKISFFPDVDDA